MLKIIKIIMKYNTAKNKLIIPEYGRHIHNMVSHAITIKDKKEKEKCVKSIIHYMGQMNPHLRDIKDYTHKLWDHLFIMSDFQLEIDSPYEKPSLEKLSEKPEKIKYPKSTIRFSYYGKYIETMISQAISMTEKKDKSVLTGMIANHMKKCYIAWSKSPVEDKTIFKHLEILSEGKLSLDPAFKIIDDSKAAPRKNIKNRKNFKKKKKNQ